MAKKKKTDPYPKDRIGQMLHQSAVVLVPYIPLEGGEGIGLMLGYVAKLGKTFADVMVYGIHGDDAIKVRVRQPSKQLVVVDTDCLDPKNPENEAVMLAAAKARTYE